MGAYFVLLPLGLLKMEYFKDLHKKMGAARFWTGMTLFLTMMLLPIKMYFRWAFNLKYFIHIQEFFLNL